jgi:hypothetical protein
MASGRPSQKLLKWASRKGEHVHRMFGHDVVPDRKATVHVAGDPGIECLDVSTFPRSSIHRQRTGGSSRVGSDRDVSKFVRKHREVTGHTMRKTELGIGSKGTGEMLRDIGAVF